MFAVIGVVVVVASVAGGYLLEKGNLAVLMQPAEFVIIFGAALGSLIIASPKKVLVCIVGGLKDLFAEGHLDRETCIELLVLLSQIFRKARKEGLLSIEADLEAPAESPTFARFSRVVKNHHVLDFICDNLKVITATAMQPHELDALMDLDIETHHRHSLIASSSIAKVADALPGLGIVAAVLGVVLTMGKISESPEVLGHSIGAALVGTFLGVLACYGFASPFAHNLEHKAQEKEVYLQAVKMALVSFVGGAAPQIAVEAGRRAIPGVDRPSFSELEEALKSWKEKT